MTTPESSDHASWGCAEVVVPHPACRGLRPALTHQASTFTCLSTGLEAASNHAALYCSGVCLPVIQRMKDHHLACLHLQQITTGEAAAAMLQASLEGSDKAVS